MVFEKPHKTSQKCYNAKEKLIRKDSPMQYPPQQPTNQPYHPPSEIYVQGQSQAYLPTQEITQPPVLAQEIAIYPNRKQAIWRTTVCAVALFFAVLLLIFFAFFFHFLAESSPAGSDFDSLIIFVCFLALILAEIAFAGWATWRIASTLLFSHKPLLLINREGITVGRMPSLSGFSIPWAEIESIHTSTFMYKYLCIRPRDQKDFLKRFSLLERGIRLSNALIGVPPLIVPQVCLERPVEEILRTLYHMYASELSYYRVQLRP